MGNISAESPLIFLILITGDIPTGVSGTGTLAGVTVLLSGAGSSTNVGAVCWNCPSVYDTLELPKKSVRIP